MAGFRVHRRRPSASERGASLSEYALILSLFVTATAASIGLIEDRSGSFLVDSGSRIGEPPPLAADYGLADPVTPPWLTQPPPPTTTTTTTTTTSTTTTSTSTTTAPSAGLVINPVHSGLCLGVEAAGNFNGARVLQETCTGATSQQWQMVDLGTGYFEFRAVHSGKCLDVSGVSTSPGAYVHTWDCIDGDNQKWAISSHPAGGSRLTVLHSGQCLDISGGSTAPGEAAIQWTCHTGSNQGFTIS